MATLKDERLRRSSGARGSQNSMNEIMPAPRPLKRVLGVARGQYTRPPLAARALIGPSPFQLLSRHSQIAQHFISDSLILPQYSEQQVLDLHD